MEIGGCVRREIIQRQKCVMVEACYWHLVILGEGRNITDCSACVSQPYHTLVLFHVLHYNICSSWSVVVKQVI